MALASGYKRKQSVEVESRSRSRSNVEAECGSRVEAGRWKQREEGGRSSRLKKQACGEEAARVQFSIKLSSVLEAEAL